MLLGLTIFWLQFTHSIMRTFLMRFLALSRPLLHFVLMVSPFCPQRTAVSFHLGEMSDSKSLLLVFYPYQYITLSL